LEAHIHKGDVKNNTEPLDYLIVRTAIQIQKQTDTKNTNKLLEI